VYSNSGLISLRYDGTDRRTHLCHRTGVRDATPPAADGVLISPDGKWALADVNNQLWVVAVPVHRHAPTVAVRSPSLPVKRLTDIGSDFLGPTAARSLGDRIDLLPAPVLDDRFRPSRTRGRGGAPGDPAKPEEKTSRRNRKQEAAKKKEPLDLDKNVERVEVAIRSARDAERNGRLRGRRSSR
jgi:hypothetical protein